MRALAVQQRTVWHPGTVAENSTFIPASSAPAGLPEGIATVRLLKGRDIQDPALARYPVAKETQMIVSAYILHNPQCQAANHFILISNLPVSLNGGDILSWPGLAMGLPEHKSWTLVQKSRDFRSESTNFNTGKASWIIDQPWNGICSYYIADDRITITP